MLACAPGHRPNFFFLLAILMLDILKPTPYYPCPWFFCEEIILDILKIM